MVMLTMCTYVLFAVIQQQGIKQSNGGDGQDDDDGQGDDDDQGDGDDVQVCAVCHPAAAGNQAE